MILRFFVPFLLRLGSKFPKSADMNQHFLIFNKSARVSKGAEFYAEFKSVKKN